MNNSIEMINEILAEELDVIAKDKRKAVAKKIVDELKLDRLQILSLDNLPKVSGSFKPPVSEFMNKQITTAIIYEIPIIEYECVKKFIAEAESYAKEYNKNDMWLHQSLTAVNQGLKVMFLHVWDVEEQIFDGMHYDKQMVFQAYLSFNTIDYEMYPMGEFCAKNIESLTERYENNPDFIFSQLDWDAPKEEIIEGFLDDLKKYDCEYDYE